MSHEVRLTELEIRITEQDKIIEDLSGEVAEQWKIIDQLRFKLNSLTNRFLELEEQTQPDIPVTRPPHW